MSIDSLHHPGVMIRQFDPSRDVFRLLHFFNFLEMLDGDLYPSTEAHVRSQMNWRGHNPTQDRWVIDHPYDPANIIGHAWIFKQTAKRAACKIAVHPYWQRQGLGSSLLPYVLRRAQEMGVNEVVSGCDSTDTAALRFLDRHGFQARSSNWFLLLSAAAPIAEPYWPSPYTVRRYNEIEHLPTLVDILNRCFHDIPGHAENEIGVITVESITGRLGKTLIPEDIFLVYASLNVPVGICGLRLHGRSNNASGTDILDEPGVVPEHRHQNLYIPLALTAVQWQRQQSKRDLILESYGAAENIIADYQGLGFQLQSRFIEYGRLIT
ncbi:MAG: GNAT family N-acetyltransferase [Chloroflexi bacterium]|nr:GNAT family N-acetyltransferase [Chloroflexota bacterium]